MAVVAFDASALLLALAPEARAPLDPETQQPVEMAAERMRHLLATLEAEKVRIIIPTPAFAEIVVRVTPEAAARYHGILTRNARIKLEPFDTLASFELAEITRTLSTPQDKRGGIDAPWSKVKFDRQILAIARVHQVERIYTDDGPLGIAAGKLNMPVVRTCDLDLPPEDKQGKLPL